MLKPLYLLLISILTFITLHFAISITLSQSDIASISAMTDLIENDFRRANSSPKSSKWKQVNTKFIYFIAKPLPPPSKLLASESSFLPRIADKFRARTDYYHPPVNHHYQTNNYKTNNYEHKEYKPPSTTVYKPPPIYIQAPVYAKEKEKDKFPLLLIGAALLFPLLALFLQFLFFLFFLQNNNINITVNVPVFPGRRRRRDLSGHASPWISEEALDSFNDRLNRAIIQFDTSFKMD